VARNSNAVQREIFERLATWAAERDFSSPPGSRRIFLSEDEYDIFVQTAPLGSVRFGRAQAAALIGLGDARYVAAGGFAVEFSKSLDGLDELEASAGFQVAMIADLSLEPSANASAVYDVVASAASGVDGYEGHDLELVARLLPPMRLFKMQDPCDAEGSFLAHVVAICVEDALSGNGWIDESLADSLRDLAARRIQHFPYEALARAALDLSPASLYLALYKCLEATYAFVKASALKDELDIEGGWIRVAKALGETLSWYPRHDQSLSNLLARPEVSQQDLHELAVALDVETGDDQVVNRVSNAVRELRNGLVHYGPTTKKFEVPGDDWNSVCTPLARIVGSVFSHAYGGAT